MLVRCGATTVQLVIWTAGARSVATRHFRQPAISASGLLVSRQHNYLVKLLCPKFNTHFYNHRSCHPTHPLPLQVRATIMIFRIPGRLSSRWWQRRRSWQHQRCSCRGCVCGLRGVGSQVAAAGRSGGPVRARKDQTCHRHRARCGGRGGLDRAAARALAAQLWCSRGTGQHRGDPHHGRSGVAVAFRDHGHGP
jgi:hypothetical protein